MQPLEAFKILDTKLEEHGLAQLGWKSDSMRAKKIVGRCNYRKKVIELSWPLMLVNSVELITDTILHEIAHGLVGPGHHHNLIWQHKAVQIGARPIRCAVGAVQVEGVYKMKCLCPNRIRQYHRRPRVSRYCLTCKYDLVHESVVIPESRLMGLQNVRQL